MSRRVNCYDNAAMENSWGTLRLELIHRHQFATYAQVPTVVFDYIEALCSRGRAHTAPCHLSPIVRKTRGLAPPFDVGTCGPSGHQQSN